MQRTSINYYPPSLFSLLFLHSTNSNTVTISLFIYIFVFAFFKSSCLLPLFDAIREMHQGSRSRRRAEKLDHCKHHDAGVRRQIRASKITYDSDCYNDNSMKGHLLVNEFRQSVSKKPTSSTFRGLVNEGVSQRMKNAHSSSSIIERLMGLDTTPPQIISRQGKNNGSCLPAVSSQRNYFSQEHFSWKKPEDEHLKDVHDVVGASNVKSHKELLTMKEHMKQRFLGSLSSEETFQYSKRIDDALEIQDCKEELLLDSLFKKHVKNLKPSKCAKSGRFEASRSRKKSLRMDSYLHNEILNSFEKPVARVADHKLEKHGQIIPYKSSTLHYPGKNESHVQPSHIVLLKPNHRKEKMMAGDIFQDQGDFHLGTRKDRKFAISGMQELCEEARIRKMLSYDGYKAKSSIQIANEIIGRLRRKASMTSQSIATSECKVCNRNYSPCVMTELDRHCQFIDDFNERLNREARIDLSQRWKIKRDYEENRLAAKGSSSLDEMLALSDRMPFCTSVDPLNYKKVANRKFVQDEVLEMWDFPLKSCRKGGFHIGSYGNSHRFKSVDSASADQSSKFSNRKQVSHRRNCYMLKDLLHIDSNDLCDSDFFTGRTLPLVRGSRHVSNKHRLAQKVGEENILSKREIQVHSEERSKSNNVRYLSEEKPLLADPIFGDREDQIYSISIPIFKDIPHHSTCQDEKEEKNVLKMPLDIEDLSCTVQRPPSAEEPCAQHPVDYGLQSEAEDQGHNLILRDFEQLSPVSVLQPPSEEESSNSGCFEIISSNLGELRRQLKLLKLESRGTYEEEISSDEEYQDGYSVITPVNVLQAFGNEGDRDFLYLQDMLIKSGIHNASAERLSEYCSSVNTPVSSHVFEKLEKKYGHAVFWLRSERKLLFDLTNSILAGIIGPSIDLRPWVSSRGLISPWNQDRLVGTLWKMVVKHRKDRGDNPDDKLLETKWLCLEDSIEEVGSELARMLTDDLLEELIVEFVVG